MNNILYRLEGTMKYYLVMQQTVTYLFQINIT